MDNEDNTEKVPKFHCKYCDYYTSRKSQWKRHLETRKQAQSQMDKKKSSKKFQKVPKQTSKYYECMCGKKYKFRSGYVNIRKSARVLM